MAGGLSDQVHRLFNFGAIGTLSDAQLLDRFVARRDEAAEAAFEELVSRHGPMVLRVCRGILHDAHDAEDAFQAAFLVLANRARSIHPSGSVASWLFGVAQRVANRGKRSTWRRHTLHRLLAERTAESDLPPENDPDREILHEEIGGLPERLRAPIVLCYLQGLTYATAAHQLGLTETALRGRLARAREPLRQRLTRRGVTAPAGLLVAGAAGHAQAAIPAALVHSTSHIALGFLAGNTATVLARGVLHSMLLDRLRVATILLGLGLGGSYWAWQALAAAVDGEGQVRPGPAVAKAPASPQPPRVDRYGDPLPPGAAMRLGTVRFRHAPDIRHIVYSPDGQLVVTGQGGRGRLLIWDARDGKSLRQIDLGSQFILDFAFAPDGRTIAAAGFELEPKRNVVLNHLTFADVATSRPIRRSEWDDRGNVQKVAYAPDGKTVATVSSDSTLRLWDVATTKLLHRERLIGDARLSPESVAFSPDAASRLLAIIAREQTIHLWDVAHLRRARSIAIGRDYRPDCLVFSPDGTILAAGVASRGAEIRLWDVGDGVLLRRFKSRKNTHVNHMAFSPDGKVLAASRGEVVFFDTVTGKELDSFGKEFASGMGFDLLADSFSADRPLAFSPDGGTLAATGSVSSLHFWDLATGKDRLATPEAHLGNVTALACPADGQTLVSGSRDRTVRIWDLVTGRPTRTLRHDDVVNSLSASADGSLLATSSWRSVHLWNLKTGERHRTWSIDRASVRGLAIGADGSSVIAALGGGSLRRWDVSTGKELPIAQPKLEKPSGNEAVGPDDFNRAVFSRGGRSVAFMGGGLVQVMDLRSGDRWFREQLGDAFPLAGEFAPDGRSLAIIRKVSAAFRAGDWVGSSTAESTIVWLDSRTGHVRREITIPESNVGCLGFSPDGEAIAVGTSPAEPVKTNPARGTIRIFRLRDKQEIQTMESPPCAWIRALCFTPSGKQIVAGLGDTSIVVWDVRRMDERR